MKQYNNEYTIYIISDQWYYQLLYTPYSSGLIELRFEDSPSSSSPSSLPSPSSSELITTASEEDAPVFLGFEPGPSSK